MQFFQPNHSSRSLLCLYNLQPSKTLHIITTRILLSLQLNPKTRNMNSLDAATTSTVISMENTGAEAQPKAPPAATPPVARAVPFAAFFRKTKAGGGWRRGVACFDFLLRLFALAAVLGAAIAMGTADETLPFFTEHFQFHANYSDFPALTFFVVGNAIAAGYLLLSLPFSLVGLCRPRAAGPRILLLIFDVVMVALTTASAASAAAIVYLAHEGNSGANWVAICLRFEEFCQQSSGAVVASFLGVVIFMLLVVMSALALRKH